MSRLVLWRTGEVLFAPMFRRSAPVLTFPTYARACCGMYRGHFAPQVGCSCGFYAVQDPLELLRLGPLMPEAVLVDVQLGGRVVEHDFGVRAEVQLVERVRVPSRCGECEAAEAVGFSLHPAGMLLRDLRPVCSRCMAVAQRMHWWRCSPMSFDDVASRLGVPLLVELPDGSVSEFHEPPVTLLGESR